MATDRHFDAGEALALLSSERVELTMVIGDATARPLADRLALDPGAFDLGRLQVIASGGAILSPAVKALLHQVLPHTKIVDTFGASETGGQGRLASPRTDHGEDTGGAPRLITDDDSAVFDDELRPLAPGTGAIGRLGRTGHIPFGYYKDVEKTAATFPMIDGVRWAVPGDYARVEADGSITLLGRGSMSINTGGEKVFPEEVEATIKNHPSVFDAIVVGMADDRFGQQVVAVVSLRTGLEDGSPAVEDTLAAHARRTLSGYKVPRTWVFVAHCERLPTGKGDYRWAARTAAEALAR